MATYPGQVLQTARRPRHLALLALACVMAGVFVWLGVWQWGAAHQHAREQALAEGPRRPVAQLDAVVRPHEPFPDDGSLRRVTVTGRYDAAKQLLVPERRLDGRTGYWVITPLVADSTKARVVVLRGFVTDPAAATRPDGRRTVTVSGALAPSESPTGRTDLPSGQIGSVDVGALVNEWGGEVYNAFLFGTAERPRVTTGLSAVPPPSPEVDGLDWRNIGYSLQWYAFAAFAFYLWWRSVREDHLDELAAAQAHDGDPNPTPTTPEDTHV